MVSVFPTYSEVLSQHIDAGAQRFKSMVLGLLGTRYRYSTITVQGSSVQYGISVFRHHLPVDSTVFTVYVTVKSTVTTQYCMADGGETSRMTDTSSSFIIRQ